MQQICGIKSRQHFKRFSTVSGIVRESPRSERFSSLVNKSVLCGAASVGVLGFLAPYSDSNPHKPPHSSLSLSCSHTYPSGQISQASAASHTLPCRYSKAVQRLNKRQTGKAQTHSQGPGTLDSRERFIFIFCLDFVSGFESPLVLA